jgi:hypothetical protein
LDDILSAMDAIIPKLEALEAQMTRGDFGGKNLAEVLGPNPQAACSRLVEFKAALDRMRGITWVYMEAAASVGRTPVPRIPQPLKEFLQQQATRSHSRSVKKARR